jgi:hypothetical protein
VTPSGTEALNPIPKYSSVLSDCAALCSIQTPCRLSLRSYCRDGRLNSRRKLPRLPTSANTQASRPWHTRLRQARRLRPTGPWNIPHRPRSDVKWKLSSSHTTLPTRREPRFPCRFCEWTTIRLDTPHHAAEAEAEVCQNARSA